MRLTPEMLDEIGAVLYGATWQTALSRHLEVNDRTVRRWAAGESPIPETVVADLVKLLWARRDDLNRVLTKLERGKF